jgi:hypothetical protein
MDIPRVTMRVTFERFGGLCPALMNRVPRYAAELTEEEEKEVRQWIDPSFYRLQSSAPSPGDAFRYELIVEDAERNHRVVLAERDVPDALRPLIVWLERRAGLRK